MGALLLAWVLFFWRPLLTSAAVPRGGGDLNSFFFPLHAFAARVVQEGAVPLWNPALFSGLPHWANYQAGILYPLNWIMYLAARPFSYAALERLVLVHYLIASLGAYALARSSLRLSPLPALVAGIVFPYSGFLVAHLGHYSMLAAAVWIPWLWLALARALETRRWLWTVPIALATWLLATGGHQQTVLYGMTGALLWWLANLWRARWEERQRMWAALQARSLPALRSAVLPLLGDAFRAAVGIGSGFALAAPVLLPSLELARRSVRSGGLSYEAASEFAMQPLALVNFVLPRVFGDNPTNWWGPWASGEVWPYAGVVTLVLTALALLGSREPLRWALAAIGLLALLHALGPATPIHGWVYRFFPFADLLRAPARSLLFVDLALALLAALGLATALRPGQLLLRSLSPLARWLLVAVGVILFLVVPLFLLAVVMSTTPPEPAVRAVDGFLLLVVWLALAAAWLRALRTSLPRESLGLAGIGLVLLDLFSATSTFNPTPVDLVVHFRHPEVVDFLYRATQEEGPWRLLALTILWQPSAAAVHDLEDAGGLFDPMQPAAYARVLDCARSAPERPLLDLLNVRYLLTRTDDGTFSPHFTKRLESESGLVVWENADALPRAWLRGSASVAETEDVLARLCSDAFDPRAELYLDGPLPPADPTATGTATATWEGPNRLRLAVEASAPAYLVVAVSHDPGWRAELEGQPTSLVAANGIYQALWIPAGRHTVLLTYRPAWLTWGIAVALVGMGVLGTSVAIDRVQRRRGARAPAAPGQVVTGPAETAAPQ